MRGRPLIELGASVATVAVLVSALLSHDTQLRIGLFGLLGTLVGALATLEATELKARRESKARARSAGRLLQEDLIFARTRCHNAQSNKHFWSPRLDLRLDGWLHYRETVSQELKDTREWQATASAFEAMRSVQGKCEALRPEYGPRPGLGNASRAVIADYLLRSDPAIDALRRLSGDRPPDAFGVPDEGT